jgi:hypothetical protein
MHKTFLSILLLVAANVFSQKNSNISLTKSLNFKKEIIKKEAIKKTKEKPLISLKKDVTNKKVIQKQHTSIKKINNDSKQINTKSKLPIKVTSRNASNPKNQLGGSVKSTLIKDSKTKKPIEKIVANRKKIKAIVIKEIIKKEKNKERESRTLVDVKIALQKNQSLKKITAKLNTPKKIQELDTFAMTYPLLMEEASISQHYGVINIGNGKYNNEGVTFLTIQESLAYCNIDSALVTEIYKDEENIYSVFLKKDKYVIVFSNLQEVLVEKDSTLRKYNTIGKIANDESEPEKASLEIMLFKNNRIVNPEKYLKKEDMTTLSNNSITKRKP